MNFFNKLKVFLLFLFFTFSFLLTKAQNHFIYIETESKEPFTVSLNGKNFSSSDGGHIIIPKLTDGKYELKINFTKSKLPAQSFSCTIDKSDLGFMLKNIPAKGWSLVDMKTSKENLSNNASAGNELNDVQESSGAFGDMLSKAVNDTALTAKSIITAPPTSPQINEQKQEDQSLQQEIDSAVKAVDVTDAINDNKDSGFYTIDTLTAEDMSNLITPELAEVTSDTTKAITEIQDSSEIITVPKSVSNIQANNNNKDSQEVFTPTDSVKSEISNPFFNKEENKTANANNSSAENQNINTPITNVVQQETNIVALKVTNEQPSTSVGYKQDCREIIQDDELDKIKRKMFVQSSNTAMVQTGVKLIGSKCLTTEQVKKLSGLFTSDDGRYTLFDAMYSLVYDRFNYASLESQMVDPYYRKRFEAMIVP